MNWGGVKCLQVTFMGVIMRKCYDNVALGKGRKENIKTPISLYGSAAARLGSAGLVAL